MNPYDALPYGGLAVPLSHPDRLAAAALRAGLSPADPARCRVLEIGCAEGANLVPMAYHLAQSELVGVDSSARELEVAVEARDRLGLDNLTLHHADVRALGEELGAFDFVIVHGVFSWVDDDVRAALLARARAALAPSGLLYLSYNCAAGWALKAEMREMMLRQTAGLDAIEDRVRVMREILALLASSPLREVSLHAAALAERAESASEGRDAYLLHEYLSPHNRSFRHREIVALTARHDLSFVSEMSSATQRASLEDTLRRGLAQHLEDAVEVEDVLDTMVGRAFRASLFCRAEDAPAAPPDPAAVAPRLSFRGRVRPKSARFSLEPDVAETFVGTGDEQLSVREPWLKAALVELSRAWPTAMPFEALLDRAGLLLELRRVELANADEARAAVTADLLELVRLEHLSASPRAPQVATEASPTPAVEPLTRLEAERGPVVTSPFHELVVLDPFARLLVRHLDGTRPLEVLVARMREHLEAGDVRLETTEAEPLAGDDRERALVELVQRSLALLRDAALLRLG